MIFLIEEDFMTRIYITFIRYFLGNSFHSGQTCLIYEAGIEKWDALIPTKADSKSQADKPEQSENV